MKQVIRSIGLILLCIHHFYAWSFLVKIGNTTVSDARVEKKLSHFKDMGWRFLTNWNFMAQTIYLITALILQFGPNSKLFAKLRHHNKLLFWSVVVPLTTYIPILFWSLYIYDRDLILPREIDQIFPVWINHCVHTNILIMLAFELATNDESLPQFMNVFIRLTCMAAIYVSLLVFTHFYNHVWLYPYLGVFTWPQRITYFLLTYFFFVGASRICFYLKVPKTKTNTTKTTKSR